MEYIRSRKGNEQPFFLYFPLPSPHAPIVPNDKFNGTSKAGAYGDFVVQTDDSCGHLLNALREAGVYENAIIIFSADNGAERYASDPWRMRNKPSNASTASPASGRARAKLGASRRISA